MKNIFQISLLSIIASAIIACAPTEKTYTVETIDGVRYIHNLTPLNENSRIGLEFIQKIGDFENEDENFMLFQPADVNVDSKGNIWIMDNGNFKVKKFTSDGKYLMSVGSQGSGPEEFIFMGNSFGIDAEDNLYIPGLKTHQTKIFTSSGDFISSNSMDKYLNITKAISADKFFGDIWLGGKSAPEAIFYMFDKHGKVVQNYGTPREYADPYMVGAGNTASNTMDNNNNVYLNYSYRNRIEKINENGTIEFVITRSFDYPESEKFLNDEFRIAAKPFGSGIGVDHKGRIWSKIEIQKIGVISNENERDFKFEIFSSEGILLEYLEFDDLKEIDEESANLSAKGKSTPNFKIFRIRGDRLFIIDGTNEQWVKEYVIKG